MPTLVYTGPHDSVDVPVPDPITGERVIVCVRGEPVEIPQGLAGRPPKGDEPGDGLLAQVDAWQPAPPKPAPNPKEA